MLTPDQAERLGAIERGLPDAAPADDEQLRFVTGFADVFVTIGVLLFVGALFVFMDAGSGSTPALAGTAAATWLLAEFFTAKRRMALPSIVLLVLFVAAVLVASLQLFTALLPAAQALPERLWFVPVPNAAALAAAAVLTAGLAGLHYLRFRVPITVAAGSAALCLLALGAAVALVPAIGVAGIDAVLFCCGLAVFALAMRFDVGDPARVTRRADIAFWLHLLAAPLVVHPLLIGLTRGSGGGFTVAAAVGVLWVFILLGILAVIIDRRAVLVSGLVYAGFAFGTLMRTVGVTGDAHLLPAVLLALGAFILLLSAGWQPLRRAILRRLPRPLARRLPHPFLAPHT